MIEIFYWILLLLKLVLGFVDPPAAPWGWGRRIVYFMLFLLIGLTIFHNPLAK